MTQSALGPPRTGCGCAFCALPQRWSRWVYDAPAALDGILYPSRLLPDHENTALFDRCRDRLEEDLGTLAR